MEIYLRCVNTKVTKDITIAIYKCNALIIKYSYFVIKNPGTIL